MPHSGSPRVVALVAAAAIVSLVQVAPAQTPASPAASAPAIELPAWAFPIPPARAGGGARRGAAAPARGRSTAPPDTTLLSVPNSTRRYTAAQTRNSFDIADWHPEEHGPMPEVVSHGRRPDVQACGYCHLANGFGKPENAPLAGQPVEYLIQQMRDFRDGTRAGSEPRIVGPSQMKRIASAATDEEIRIAAEYFAGITRKPWIRVVEADQAPIVQNAGVMYRVVEGEGAGVESIGNRIVEVAENYAATALRDGGSGFIAYVPTGAVARGRALATTGGGRTIACSTCHGADLRGLGPVPSIAGRSPSYMGRQMYDFKTGARHGAMSAPMTEVVARLTDEDIVDLLAYVATLAP